MSPCLASEIHSSMTVIVHKTATVAIVAAPLRCMVTRHGILDRTQTEPKLSQTDSKLRSTESYIKTKTKISS